MHENLTPQSVDKQHCEKLGRQKWEMLNLFYHYMQHNSLKLYNKIYKKKFCPRMSVTRDHTDGTVNTNRRLTGYQKGEFTVEETGISWCE